MTDPNRNALMKWASSGPTRYAKLNWNRVNEGMINSALNDARRNRPSTRAGGTSHFNQASAMILKKLQKLSSKVARESRGDEYQWVIIRKSGNTFSIVPTRAQGYAVQNWRLNYVFNKSFPAVKLSTNQQTNNANAFLRSIFVGKNPCATKNANAQGVCGSSGTWTGGNYKVVPKGLGRVIVKKGSASPGVANMATLIETAGKVSIAGPGQVSAKVLRARYLEAKRNGDYFQIFTCFMVNNDPSLFIIKPGDDDLADSIDYNPVTYNYSISSSGIDQMKKLVKVDKFYFDKCCFWTCDRPAGFFAMLMGVPTVKRGINVAGAGQRLNYVPENYFKNQIGAIMIYVNGLNGTPKFNKARDCILNILNDWRNNRGTISLNSLQTKTWYLKMCIFDTCHDFGHGVRSPKRLVALIQNVLKSFVLTNRELVQFIDDVFASIEDMESIADMVIQKVAELAGNSLGYEQTQRKGVYDNLVTIFNNAKMCYVFDCGTTPPVTHPFRLFRALLSAKLYDPS